MTPSEDIVQLAQNGRYVRLTLADDRAEASSLRDDNGAEYVLLSEAEIDDLIVRLQAAKDPNVYVQVRYLSGMAALSMSGTYGSGLYTYVDPSGELEVGDFVEVPTSFAKAQVAKVEKLGKGTFKGKIKIVSAKLAREELS